MNKLYFVKLYNFQGNQSARIMVTVLPTDGVVVAENLAMEPYGKSWKVEFVAFVCNTPDVVNMEL